MSDTTTIAQREVTHYQFVSVEHGDTKVTLGIFDTSKIQEVARQITLSPTEAYQLAGELKRHADATAPKENHEQAHQA